MKLALGTVQFGLKYGAFNVAGQTSEVEAAAILDVAYAAGIDTLDTAQAYGESERVLGRLNAASRFRIVSKCPPITDLSKAADSLRYAVDKSCTNLKTDHLAGFLLHRAEDLSDPAGDSIWQALQDLHSEGRIGKFGVSTYDKETINTLSKRYHLGLAQVPANVLDPWYENDDLPKHMELHVRSVFLQGFLLSDPQSLSPFHAQWRSVLEDFRTRATDLGLSPLQAAIAPLLHSPRIDRLVLGVDSVIQFNEVLSAVTAPQISSLGSFGISGADLLDPRTWPNS